jgi:DNA-binding beta-propeller fold protein YncE
MQTRRRTAVAATATLVAMLLWQGATMAQVGGGRVRAPDFTGADRWLNTAAPLTIEELRGRVVLLDFWTYCCINCMHIFPDLKYLEDKYRDQPLVVIGVHSGKFSQEKDPENIRQAVLRHNIAHPVAVDSAYKIWNAYTVRAWPTLILIDPQGYIVQTYSGEGHRADLDQAIGRLLEENRRSGTLAAPLTFQAERAAFQSGVLEFPGKVLADAAGQRLFISDTNHQRVLVAGLDGAVRDVIGGGQSGLRDGTFAEAQFHQPQGLALSADGKTLYVADTENHALRGVDLAARKVTTLAGTGQQATEIMPGAAAARQTALSSPWDLALVGERLFIAMAGPHQIWTYDPQARQVRVFAGTGREAAQDGPNERAGFAQPSGLASDGKVLYVADSEASSIRAVDARATGRTRTLAGSGDLFGFGADDGVGSAARFQHPLGVALHGDTLFVADTFNHLIRAVDVKSGAVTRWLGTGRPEPGTADAIGLAEPGGLSVAGETLYVADTNNHRVLAIDIATRAARVVDVRLPGAAEAKAVQR